MFLNLFLVKLQNFNVPVYLVLCSVTSQIHYSDTENSGLSRLFTSDPFGDKYIGVQLLIDSQSWKII